MAINKFLYPDKLRDAIEFFCRVRIWIGEGYDIIVCGKTKKAKCYCFESVMGETIEKNPIPKFIVNKKISSKRFKKFIRRLIDQGIMEFETDHFCQKMNNYNDFYFILLENGNFNCFQIVCGHHRDPRFGKILDIIDSICAGQK